MTRKSKLYLSVLALILPLGLMAQATITGSVTSEDGAALAGANVIVEGTSLGAAADASGNYNINGVSAGNVTVTASFVGYESSSSSVSVPASGSVTVNFSLAGGAIEVAALQIIAGRAKHRETPVAFTDVTGEDVKMRNASRDLPMILNETPGVYASMQGGGSGDSRVNVRGFDQRNTAVLINGVPVNDMENGWVYWSNWDGVADVTQSIQVQRGLGASNLAIASVGGTINVLTSAADAEAGGLMKQEVGSDGFLKTTVGYSTGRLTSGLAASAAIVRKTGEGYADGTWTDSWAYFFTLNKVMGKHVFDATLLGAPQQHGQRYSSDQMHTIDEWETLFEGDLRVNSGYNGSYDGTGAGWGYISKDNYDMIIDNQGEPSSLDGLGKALFGGIQQTKKVGGDYIINNRTNYYHKPVYNLNWYWDISEKTSLSTVLYGSNGFGGGTGPLNNRGNNVYWNDDDSTMIVVDSDTTYTPGAWNSASVKYINPGQSDDGFYYDWNAFIEYNSVGDGSGYFSYNDTVSSAYSAWNDGKTIDTTYSDSEVRSKAIIRASVNSHNWYGAISTLKHNLNDVMIVKAGIDIRSYEGIHYREVVNLLGADYFVDEYYYGGKDYSDINEVNPEDGMNRVGDKIAYHNIGYNKWIGGFGQFEYKSPSLSVFASLALSRTEYQREDFFNYTDESGDQLSEKGIFPGFAFKTGANYNLSETMNVYGNVGYMTIAPNFTNVYLNYVNDLNENATNELVTAFEVGYGYSGRKIGLNANYYLTLWADKAMVKTDYSDEGELLIYNIAGLSARHSGLEFDLTALLMRNLKVNAAVALSDWVWIDDVSALVTPDNDRSGDPLQIDIYSKDLHVGNAPQNQFSFGAVWTPIKGLRINPVIKYFDKHYADFDPSDRENSDDREDSFKLDSAMLVDLHAGYSLKLAGFPISFDVHMLNALDEEYISDAVDGSSHTEDDVDVYYGLGTRINTSITINF